MWLQPPDAKDGASPWALKFRRHPQVLFDTLFQSQLSNFNYRVFFGFQLDSSSWTGWKIPSSVETTLREELCLLAAGRRCLYVLSLLHIFILLIFRVLHCRSSCLLSGSADLGRVITSTARQLWVWACSPVLHVQARRDTPAKSRI